MSLSISSYCFERLSTSFSIKEKICLSISLSSASLTIFDYFVALGGIPNLYQEIKENTNLLLGNQIINGIIILSEVLDKNRLIETLKTLDSHTYDNFFVIHFNGNCLKAYESRNFEEINVKILNREETFAVLKDYFIFFTSFEYIYNEKGFCNFNLDDLKKVRFFQIKENDVLVSINSEIISENSKNNTRNEKIKDFIKNMKNEFKQVFKKKLLFIIFCPLKEFQ
jgi:hypothetical protein